MPSDMIVGITGHMTFQSQKMEKWVFRELRCWLYKHDIALGLTNLAPGADQMFADLCLKQMIPYRAIVPCEGYSSVFNAEQQRRLSFFLSKASSTQVLNFSKPSEEAFGAGGKAVVEQADVLLAVWDGKPGKGSGGTCDTVHFARSRGKAIVHFHPLLQKITEILPPAQT